MQSSTVSRADIYFNSTETVISSVAAPQHCGCVFEGYAETNTAGFSNPSSISDAIDVMIEPYESLLSLMCTIPGLDRKSAITILSEIGNDVSCFNSSKQLCSWAGLTPGNNESAGKKKSVRITRAGVYLKPALVEVAHAAVKSTKPPYYKTKYEKIAKRRVKKRAIITIARMILTAIYSMLSTGEIRNPVDLFKIDMPAELREKQEEKAIKQAIKFLESKGLAVS